MPAYDSREITEGFPATRTAFEALLADLVDPARSAACAATEEFIATRAREVQRLMLQEWLEKRAAGEQRAQEVAGSDGVVRRCAEKSHARLLSTRFGTVQVERIAYRAKGASNLYPADAELDLPTGRHSHTLKKLAAVEAARGSFADAQTAVERATGTHTGKRQTIQLVQRTAADIDAFYTFARSASASGSGSGSGEMLLVLSADGKGVVMRPDALREETRRAAARKAASGGGPYQTRLAGGEKSGRKRMATVGAVYALAAQPRGPQEVIRPNGADREKRPDRPRATDKWLTASVAADARTVIAAVFDHAERRDPARTREWVMLVDGARRQLDLIHEQCDARELEVHVLIDFVHVLEYLWGAAWCFFAPADPGAEPWVGGHALAILQGTAQHVADALEQQADAAQLSEHKRAGVDKAVGYLRAKLPYLGYDIALAEGWPIAAGVIEGACRHLIKDRMDITGARWGLPGAEAVLKLRAVISNGDFEAYWEYHVQREHLRVHTVRYRDTLELAA
ncbi:ISKra4 family transposase [Streptomyces sp. Edi2]|uniref:ISKra4 family transposase n=1 Tax=Streptomyces sp. Edi2 TaxID=3162528 RepID=UPI0033060144